MTVIDRICDEIMVRRAKHYKCQSGESLPDSYWDDLCAKLDENERLEVRRRMTRTVQQTWVISWNGGSWVLGPFHVITVLSSDPESDSSRIKFDMPGPSGSSESYLAVVPTRDVELYTVAQ